MKDNIKASVHMCACVCLAIFCELVFLIQLPGEKMICFILLEL